MYKVDLDGNQVNAACEMFLITRLNTSKIAWKTIITFLRNAVETKNLILIAYALLKTRQMMMISMDTGFSMMI
jgi:hypothetical protein